MDFKHEVLFMNRQSYSRSSHLWEAVNLRSKFVQILFHVEHNITLHFSSYSFQPWLVLLSI